MGLTPEIEVVVKIASQVALTELRSDSVTTSSGLFANKFIYVRDMCFGTAFYRGVWKEGALHRTVSQVQLAPSCSRSVNICIGDRLTVYHHPQSTRLLFPWLGVKTANGPKCEGFKFLGSLAPEETPKYTLLRH